MCRIVGLLPGGEVAAGIPAIRGCNLQSVVIVDVALRAGGYFSRRGHLVRVRQRETGGAVIKRRIRPICGVVAGGALRNREACGDMVWYGSAERLRAVPLRKVAP